MTADPTPATAFWVDEDYDRDHASDGHSRYGAYLARQIDRFADLIEPGPITDPLLFAVAAFAVAGSPVMAPGYVRHHPRVRHVAWCLDDHARVAYEIQVITPPPAVVAQLVRGQNWADWQREWPSGDWLEPYDNDRPGLFTVLTVRVPLPVAALPAPVYRAGDVPDTATAQAAVRAVCGQLNQHLTPILAALDSGGAR